jgi:hypothetical protein
MARYTSRNMPPLCLALPIIPHVIVHAYLRDNKENELFLDGPACGCLLELQYVSLIYG